MYLTTNTGQGDEKRHTDAKERICARGHTHGGADKTRPQDLTFCFGKGDGARGGAERVWPDSANRGGKTGKAWDPPGRELAAPVGHYWISWSGTWSAQLEIGNGVQHAPQSGVCLPHLRPGNIHRTAVSNCGQQREKA